jgi:hypothetical protein
MTATLNQHKLTLSENRRLQKIIREYTANGYKIIQPSQDASIPEFLLATLPDAIAMRDDDNVAIVIRSTINLRRSASIIKLAEVIHDHPKWRLELIVTNPKSNQAKLDNIQSSFLNRHEIYLHLAESRELIHTGHPQAAFLLLWSATAATLLLVKRQAQIQTKKFESVYLLKQLVTLAIIDQNEFQLLQEGLDLQRLIMQGFITEDIQKEFLNNLSEVTMRLLKL